MRTSDPVHPITGRSSQESKGTTSPQSPLYPMLHPVGGTGSLGLTHLPNSHLLAPRAIPWDLASAGMLNHVRGR